MYEAARLPTRLIVSPSAEARLARARAWLAQRRPDEELYVVGGTVDGALELAREVSPAATFGWHRLSFDRLALKLAMPLLASTGRSLASHLALEALWARVVHELHARDELGRFTPVAQRPGLPRALARMMTEARLEGVPRQKLDRDLARAAEVFEEALAAARLVDRPDLLELAKHAATTLPVLLLDVPAQSRREWELIASLTARSTDVLVTAAAGDHRTLRNLEQALKTPAEHLPAPGSTGLSRLQTHLFATDVPKSGPAGDDVTMLSAPGEVRECVELARLIHREAAAGTPFDRMAVLLRAPGAYRSAITEALRRASVPAYFARGTRMPHPSGRALLALLACAEERLSAARFAEYVSLGELPWGETRDTWSPPDPTEVELSVDEEPDEEEPEDENPEAPVVAGTLRAPRHWEKLLVEAAVIGGKERWVRRLDALERGLLIQRKAPDLEERRIAQLDRDLGDLKALRGFALPVLEQLAGLPGAASWGEWRTHLEALANKALRYPSRVVALFAELAPMDTVGPVTLREVKRVLSERLLELNQTPDHHRFGKVFVGPVDAARGLSFDVVFAPGLAERIFPQKVREDPVAPDEVRKRLSEHALVIDDDRRDAERLQLRLAVGAARRRIVLSYPRIDTHEGRPRVPSFYALDVLKAAEGRLPTYEELSQRAETKVDARIGWPAPRDASSAIDEAERDLSVLGTLFRAPVLGKARYLMSVNENLGRALRLRWSRWHRKWTGADGLVLPGPEAKAALAWHRLEQRSFSATALQHFAACPYRFYLSAILRLSPREEPAAIEELDPLQRGSMVHDVQFEVLTALRDQWPVTLEVGLAKVDEVLGRVAAQYYDDLDPAIVRVWEDGVEAIRADVREWMRLTLAAEWTPWKFELSFGLAGRRDKADPDSRPEAMLLEGGLKLRGSIDLVEKSKAGVLTATDYKTGKQRAEGSTRLGGGKTLQPVLYALALEQLFPGTKVEGGSLWYCTQAGHFTKVPIALDARSRDEAKSAIAIVGQAIEKGFLPAAPGKDECTYCDFVSVCGTSEERRVQVKSQQELEPLTRLRELE